MSGAFLDALTEAKAPDLRSAGRLRAYGAGVTLFHEGDDAGPVIVLLAGRVKVTSLSTAGREVIVAVRGPGDLLGEIAAVDGAPAPRRRAPWSRSRRWWCPVRASRACSSGSRAWPWSSCGWSRSACPTRAARSAQQAVGPNPDQRGAMGAEPTLVAEPAPPAPTVVRTVVREEAARALPVEARETLVQFDTWS